MAMRVLIRLVLVAGWLVLAYRLPQPWGVLLFLAGVSAYLVWAIVASSGEPRPSWGSFLTLEQSAIERERTRILVELAAKRANSSHSDQILEPGDATGNRAPGPWQE
jgi:hypothetical protein